MYKSLDGHCKERISSWRHMLAIEIPFIQGFGASNIQLGRRGVYLNGKPNAPNTIQKHIWWFQDFSC